MGVSSEAHAVVAQDGGPVHDRCSARLATAYDVLAIDGREVTRRPYWERRQLLEEATVRARLDQIRERQFEILFENEIVDEEGRRIDDERPVA